MRRSVVDGLLTRDSVLHGLDFFRGVPYPIQVFAYDPQRLAGAIGPGGITGKLLVRQIGVIREGAGRFYLVDSAWTFALGQLRSPGSCVQRLAEVDPGRLPLGVVGGITGLKQLPGLQVGLSAMVESLRVGIEDEWFCGFLHACLVIHIVVIIVARNNRGKSTLSVQAFAAATVKLNSRHLEA